MSENQVTVPVQIVNAFVKQGAGGNPAGVVLDADAYNDDQMLEIAQKVGLSETAFVSKSATEGFKLDFFTPTRRIAHCGHATVATFSYLAELGRAEEGNTSKETVDGPRKIILKEGAAYMEQLAPKYTYSADWDGVTHEDVLQSLGLSDEDLDPNFNPLLVNTGNNFVVIGVKDAAVMKKLQDDQDKINDISEKLDLIGYYVYTTDCDGVDATTRMFAPRYGIAEEAATGMAAGPLACVLFDHLDIKKETLVIEQGVFMDPASPSLITVNLELDGGAIQGLMAGGYGKVMKQFDVEIAA